MAAIVAAGALAAATSSSSNDSNDWGAALIPLTFASIIGGLALLAALAAIIGAILKCRRSKRTTQVQVDQEAANIPVAGRTVQPEEETDRFKKRISRAFSSKSSQKISSNAVSLENVNGVAVEAPRAPPPSYQFPPEYSGESERPRTPLPRYNQH